MSKTTWELLCMLAEYARSGMQWVHRGAVHADYGRAVEDALVRDGYINFQGHYLRITGAGMQAYDTFN